MKLNASEESKFYDNSDMFDVYENTGVIRFVPDEKDIGNHIITVRIEKDNLTASRSFLFDISAKEDNDSGMDLKSSGLNLTAFIGKNFEYRIDIISKSKVSFYTNSDIFDIDKTTGKIGFIPLPEDKGLHNFTIIVVDEEGNFAFEYGVIEVLG